MKKIKIGRLKDFPLNDMQEVSIEDISILVVNHNNTLRALGSACPHYGAPLADGFFAEWDEVVTTGNLDDAFLAGYFKDGRLKAALGSNNHKEMCAIEKCLRRGICPSQEELISDGFSWQTLLRKTKEP